MADVTIPWERDIENMVRVTEYDLRELLVSDLACPNRLTSHAIVG